MYFVYILYSESKQLYYKGFTENVISRVEEHNAGKSRYTANKGPWKLIFGIITKTWGLGINFSKTKRKKQYSKRL